MDWDWVVYEDIDVLEKTSDTEVEDQAHREIVCFLDATEVDGHDEDEGDGGESVEGDDGDGDALEVLFGAHAGIDYRLLCWNNNVG